MNPLILANLLALLTGFAFAAGDTAVHFALRTSTPITGILALSVVTLLIYGPVALATFPVSEIGWYAFLIFLAAGIASPGLAGTLLYMSFRRIGLSRSVTIISCAPLLTVIFAIVFFGESPTYLVFIGTLFIVLGVILLAQERQKGGMGQASGRSVWHSFIFAGLAVFMFALTAVLRKIGVMMVPSLSVGLSIAALGALLVAVVWNFFLPENDRIRIGSYDAKFLIASGVISSSGHLAFFAALQIGPLSTVAPLVYSAPLFAVFFSWIFFRKSERLNAPLIIGAILICAGAALVTMSRQ